MKDVILYHLTRDQAELLCRHYSKDLEELEEYQITELLDKFIDTLTFETLI